MASRKISAKNSGSVRQRADGRWEARATICGKRRSFYGEKQSDALKAMRAALKASDDGTFFEPSRATVGEWFDTWSNEYAVQKLKPLSLSVYRNRIDTHIAPTLGKLKLSELNPTHIQTLYNNLTYKEGLAPNTVKGIHNVLHKALSQAVKLRYIPYNPSDACELPRAHKRDIKPLTEAEITAFLTEIENGERMRDLFTVALFTGMREGEICGLSWDGVNFRKGTITVKQQLQRGRKKGSGHFIATTKNEKTRVITAAPFVMDTLKAVYNQQGRDRLSAGLAWSNQWDLVFTDELGNFTSPQTVLRRFKAICSRIGRSDARFHDLRHTFAVVSLQEGDGIKTLQQNLGHATAAFTLDVYGHVSQQMNEDSARRMENFISKIQA